MLYRIDCSGATTSSIAYFNFRVGFLFIETYYKKKHNSIDKLKTKYYK